jgi:AcrR family transcriptional regulator
MADVAHLRRVPTQQRGRDRVEQILDATEALFLELGADAITTNHIAARTGVDVAGVYYFFVDKFQIFEAVVHRAITALEEDVERCASNRAADVAGWIDALFDTHWKFARDRDPAIRLFETLRSRAEMASLVRRYDERIVGAWAEGLRIHCPEIPAARRRTVAHVMNLTMGELIYHALSSPSTRERNAIQREARILLRCYVGVEPGVDS